MIASKPFNEPIVFDWTSWPGSPYGRGTAPAQEPLLP